MCKYRTTQQRQEQCTAWSPHIGKTSYTSHKIEHYKMAATILGLSGLLNLIFNQLRGKGWSRHRNKVLLISKNAISLR